MNNPEQRWYSLAEFAEIRRVSRMTVSRWIRDGLLPGARRKGPYENSPYEIPHSALEHLDSILDNSNSAN